MRIKVDAYNIGSDGTRISPDCEVEISNPVFVYRDFDKSSPKNIIGQANISQEKDGIYADIKYFYPSGFKFYTNEKDEDGLFIPKSKYDIEKDMKDFTNQYKFLYPAIGARLISSVQKENHIEVTKIKLNEVSLCSSQNSDKLIKQIKDQI